LRKEENILCFYEEKKKYPLLLWKKRKIVLGNFYMMKSREKSDLAQ
jgi:hypothetical protein